MRKLISVLCFLLLGSICSFSQEAQIIDEFSNNVCDEYLMRMDNMLIKASANPNSTIYIFVYEGKENDQLHRKDTRKLFFPAIGSAKAKIESMKKYISNVKKLSLENFSFVEAGFRENSTVVFWLVPNGAEPPKPESTLTKMNYRKGNAKGFCIWCCDVP